MYINVHDIRSNADSVKSFSAPAAPSFLHHRMMDNVTVGFKYMGPYGNNNIINVNTLLYLLDNAEAACISRKMTCYFLRWFHYCFFIQIYESNYRHHAAAIL